MPGENSERILVFIRAGRNGEREGARERKRERERGGGRRKRTRREREEEEEERGSGEKENDGIRGAKVSVVPLRPQGLGARPLSLSLSLSLSSSFLSVLSARPPIIIIFYHNICFSHILFYVNGRCLPPSTRLVLAPFSRWVPRFVCMASGNF